MDKNTFALLESLNCVLGSKSDKVKAALDVVEKAIELYGDDLWFSFNSGKDNTACFFLVASVLYRRRNHKSLNFTMKSVYFEEEDPFDECDEYMDYIKRNFKFDPYCPKNTESLSKHNYMKHQLVDIVNNKGLKAVVMGSRKTDPYCGNLSHFSESSSNDGWPHFIRVSPIIDWDYKEIWQFFNSCNIPYCSLYDKGYTYLGDKHDSVPNPFLRTLNGWYLPASAANSNYEPFSRKSTLKNLQTNETGKIMVTENNVRNIIIRAEKVMAAEDVRREILNNLKSFEICQTIMNDSHTNLKFSIDFPKAIRFASAESVVVKINSENDQEVMLSEHLNTYISQLSQQLRIPLFVLYLDMIRKNCIIYG